MFDVSCGDHLSERVYKTRRRDEGQGASSRFPVVAASSTAKLYYSTSHAQPKEEDD